MQISNLMFTEDSKEINEVYIKVDSLFKLKIKSQLRGTALVFEKFLHVTDLLSHEKYYNLIINKKVFGFDTNVELYHGLLKVITNEEGETKKEIDFFSIIKNMT